MAFRDLVPWQRNKGQHQMERRRHRDRERERDPFSTLRREMNRLIEEFDQGMDLAPFGQPEALTDWAPRVNVSETENEIQVSAELPGLSDKNVELSLENNMLVIRGEKSDEHEEKNANFTRIERSFGSFQRAIPLGAEIQEDKVEAEFKNGVLHVRLPKNVAAQPPAKRIPVKAESGS